MIPLVERIRSGNDLQGRFRRLRFAILSAHPLALIGVAVFVAAIAIRLGALVLYGPRLGGDSPFYLSGAEGLIRNGPAGLASISVASAPLYPVFLAAVSRVSGLDLSTAAVLGQAFLGAATAALIVRITYRLSSSLVSAAVAGSLAAAHITLVFWSVYVLTETLFLFLLAVCVDRLLVLTSSRRPFIDSLTAGIFVLLVLLARPTAAGFALAVPIYALLASRGDRARLLRSAVGLSTPAAAAVLVVAMSGRAADVADLLANQVWVSIWYGLQWTEEGRGTWGVDLSGGPPDGDYRQGALAWLAADPMHFVIQAGRKLRVFWTPVLPGFSVRHAAVALAFYLPFYALSLYGMRLASRQRAGLSLLLLGVAAFTLLSMVTFVDYDQRYRLPAELLLIPLAAIGANQLICSARRRLSGFGPSRIRDLPDRR